MTWSSPPKFKFALKISVKKVEEEVFKEPFAQPGQHEEALRILKENKSMRLTVICWEIAALLHSR